MQIQIDIAESNAQVFRLAANVIAGQFNDALVRAARPMETRIRNLVAGVIEAQPEWLSLANGKLTEEFGLTGAVVKLNIVLKTWINSIVVIFQPFKLVANQLKGRYEISMIRADWSDVLNLPEAHQLTESGVSLPWLEWLLTEGDKVIIRDYDVGYSLKPGRAGGVVMLRGRGRWSVPPEYAGTISNNFVTRAIDNLSDDFERIFMEEVYRKL